MCESPLARLLLLGCVGVAMAGCADLLSSPESTNGVAPAPSVPPANSELWQQYGTISTMPPWIFIGGGDYTGDHVADIVAYRSDTGMITVGHNTGRIFDFDHAWAGPRSDLVTSQPQMISGDFNRDGKSDIAIYDPATGRIRIGVNTGSQFQMSSPWATLSPAGGWTIRAGDFDNDGWIDVLAYYPGDGSLWVGKNVSDSVTGRKFNFGAASWARLDPASGWSIQTGDFNRDRKADVLAYYTDSELTPFGGDESSGNPVGVIDDEVDGELGGYGYPCGLHTSGNRTQSNTFVVPEEPTLLASALHGDEDALGTFANMTFYRYQVGQVQKGFVFSVGSIYFTIALAYPDPTHGQPVLQQIVKNVLDMQ